MTLLMDKLLQWFKHYKTVGYIDTYSRYEPTGAGFCPSTKVIANCKRVPQTGIFISWVAYSTVGMWMPSDLPVVLWTFSARWKNLPQRFLQKVTGLFSPDFETNSYFFQHSSAIRDQFIDFLISQGTSNKGTTFTPLQVSKSSSDRSMAGGNKLNDGGFHVSLCGNEFFGSNSVSTALADNKIRQDSGTWETTKQILTQFFSGGKCWRNPGDIQKKYSRIKENWQSQDSFICFFYLGSSDSYEASLSTIPGWLAQSIRLKICKNMMESVYLVYPHWKVDGSNFNFHELVGDCPLQNYLVGVFLAVYGCPRVFSSLRPPKGPSLKLRPNCRRLCLWNGDCKTLRCYDSAQWETVCGKSEIKKYLHNAWMPMKAHHHWFSKCVLNLYCNMKLLFWKPLLYTCSVYQYTFDVYLYIIWCICIWCIWWCIIYISSSIIDLALHKWSFLGEFQHLKVWCKDVPTINPAPVRQVGPAHLHCKPHIGQIPWWLGSEYKSIRLGRMALESGSTGHRLKNLSIFPKSQTKLVEWVFSIREFEGNNYKTNKIF